MAAHHFGPAIICLIAFLCFRNDTDVDVGITRPRRNKLREISLAPIFACYWAILS